MSVENFISYVKDDGFESTIQIDLSYKVLIKCILRYSEDAGVFADDHIALPADGQKDTIPHCS